MNQGWRGYSRGGMCGCRGPCIGPPRKGGRLGWAGRGGRPRPGGRERPFWFRERPFWFRERPGGRLRPGGRRGWGCWCWCWGAPFDS